MADRIRAGVARPETGAPVTLSIGVSTCVDGDTLEDLLARSDAAMYEAKSAGRNGVASAPPSRARGPRSSTPPR